uniref:CSON006120 protein n=1 Tax=Culicoides sonorensis TaxID=179676 RepID=A0A336LZD3_CULSO
MEQNKESKEYVLSHYINPHTFWLRTPFTPQNIIQMEYKLNAHYKKCIAIPRKEFKPKVGELVAYYEQNNNRWYRATIEFHYNLSNKTRDSFIIWLIDYGFPVYASSFNLRPLAIEFQARTVAEHIIKVGVSHVLPVYEYYDFINECEKYEIDDTWNARTTAYFKEIMEYSNCIKFTAQYCNNGHFFGTVTIQGKNEKFKDAADILVKTGRAIKTEDSSNFIDDLNKIQTVNFERYQDNNHRNIKEESSKSRNIFGKAKKELGKFDLFQCKVVECYDDNPRNDVPKDIPCETYAATKVERWLDKYIKPLLMSPKPILENPDEEDEMKEMPVLIPSKSFTGKESKKEPAGLRQIASHNISRQSRAVSFAQGPKSEILERTQETVPKSDVDTNSYKTPLIRKIMEKLHQKRLAKEKDSEKANSVVTAPQSKSDINLLPAGYTQIINQENRIAARKGFTAKLEAIKKTKTIRKYNDATDAETVCTTITGHTFDHPSKSEISFLRKAPSSVNGSFITIQGKKVNQNDEEYWN